MEIHRLQTMKENYPEELFNQIYYQTKQLRKKLASQIDHRRYGVSPDIIESWFDDKFIYVFNKHFDNKDPDVLKGFIINSLAMFKYRVLRKAYSKEGEYYSNMVELEGESNLINFIPDVNQADNESIFKDLALSFMRDKLSDDAFTLLQIQLNPPPYILNRLVKHNSSIPSDLIAEFLGLSLCNKTKKYISALRKEIKLQTEMAKEYFQNNPLAITGI